MVTGQAEAAGAFEFGPDERFDDPPEEESDDLVDSGEPEGEPPGAAVGFDASGVAEEPGPDLSEPDRSELDRSASDPS